MLTGVKALACRGPPDSLAGNACQQLQATLVRTLEQNDQYFQQEREKLDAWAEDRILAASKKKPGRPKPNSAGSAKPFLKWKTTSKPSAMP
jgi:hypothetical protein